LCVSSKHTHGSEVTRMSPHWPSHQSAADLDGTPSQRFDGLWQRWPLKEQRDRAARDWLSFVTAENESEVMACAERYLASDQVARGIVKHLYNWLEQQHRDGWSADWPPGRQITSDPATETIQGDGDKEANAMLTRKTATPSWCRRRCSSERSAHGLKSLQIVSPQPRWHTADRPAHCQRSALSMAAETVGTMSLYPASLGCRPSLEMPSFIHPLSSTSTEK
jgi:hypothetical protein